MKRSSKLLLWTLLCARCQTGAMEDAVPPPPSGGPTTSSATTTYAVVALFLGEVDRDGGPSNLAWKTYGYDLDGLVTTRDAGDVCAKFPAAPRSNQTDGNLGIDNSFGQVVLPIIETGASVARPSANVTGLIAGGAWTLQIQITGLSGDPHQTAIGLRAQMFVSGPLGASPAFDSTTDWPVLPSSLADGKSIAAGARVSFATAYVTNGTFVARDASEPLLLPLQLANATPTHDPPVATLALRIRDAIVTFDVAAGENGVIAGVINGDDAVAAAVPFAHELNTSTCGDESLAIADQVRQAQDLLSDGTNRPGVSCDAISIGIGFTAAPVANPTQVGVDPPQAPDPCDAGTDVSAVDAGDAAFD